ncbi:MAG: glycosyl transferase family 1 [Saprospiraceae bacterium]
MIKPNKRVLIITYYWPPSGGPGVQRCLFFVKYLREFGWEPIVYTIDNGEYPYIDHSLEKQIPADIEVIKNRSWEPFNLYKKVMGLSLHEKLKPNVIVEKTSRPLFQSIATFIRGNLFIPDSRMFWIRPSVKFLISYLKENPVDVILSSSPPHSVQMIGFYLKKELGIPWIADMRDPWTKIFFWDKLKMTNYAIHKNLLLEKKVLQTADKVVTVSSSCAIDFENISNRKIDLITNGFDEISHNTTNISSNHFTISYGGTLSSDRNPPLLWKVMSEFLESKPEVKNKFKLQFIGAIDPLVFDSIESYGLGTYLEKKNPTAHDEYLKDISSCDVLLLIGAKEQAGVITGKFFEYLALQKPILAISPKNSDIEMILNQTHSGYNADFEDENEISKAIYSIFEYYKDRSKFKPNVLEIETYSRRNLTKQLAILLNNLV